MAEESLLVEKVARALLALRVDRTDETWQRYRQENSWKLFAEDAEAAIAAIRKHDEEAGR